MLELESLHIENVHYFRKAAVRMDASPITFIRGRNYDADAANPTGNGSGKSLLVSTIPNLFLFSPPLSQKKKAAKDIVSKKSKVTLRFKSLGNSYEITQSASGYKIIENDIDLAVRTKPLQEKFIQEIFTLREIEFYTYGYLASQRQFLMQTDTDSNRLEHFTSMFRLDNYAYMRKHFADKLSAIKGNEVKLSVLEQSALVLRKKLKKSNLGFKQSELDALRSEYEALDTRMAKLSKDEHSALTRQQHLSTLLTVETELDSLRSQYTDTRSPKEYLVYLKEQRSIAKEWDEYQSLISSYKNSVRKIEEKIKGLTAPKESLDTIRLRLEAAKEKLSSVESDIKKLDVVKAKLTELKSLGAELAVECKDIGLDHKKVRSVDPIDYSTEVSQCKSSIRLEKLLHTHFSEGTTCPTCLSEVDVSNIKKVVRSAKARLPELERAIAVQELQKRCLSLASAIRSTVFDSESYTVLKASAAKWTTRIETYEEEILTLKKLASLNDTLRSIERPTKPDADKDSDLSYVELGAQIDVCTEILRHLASKAKLMEQYPDLKSCRTVKSVNKALSECATVIGRIEKDLNTVKSKSAVVATAIEKYAVAQSEVLLYESELNDARSRIDELRPALADKDILETLIHAYSTKGLKTIVANEICGLLETNLNEYRDLIFMEPFTFTVTASDSGLSIMVDRGNNIISDVRLLSGAESNCFRLLFVLSLLPLVPDSRRLNFIVLDEPTSLMHSVTRQVFMDRYLPALMEVVPHVYVITPHSDEQMDGSTEWLVTKKGGISNVLTDPLSIAKSYR